jgi:hypothetical protein
MGLKIKNNNRGGNGYEVKFSITIAQLNDAIQSETGKNVFPFINTLPGDRTGA